jgi:hypothetical protein
MGTRAKGRFEVTLKPEPPHDTVEGVALARVHVSKRFHGELEATSTVEMLSAGTPIKGSAGYVAIERVVGTLQGRAGSFVLVHTGIMNRGTPSLQISVVPDSGTGALRGISGRMGIEIVDGQHSYDFEYAIDAG